MREQADAKEDRAAAIVSPARSSMPWRVRDVTVLSDYRLSVRFLDGLTGTVDMSMLVTSSGAGVFASLRDPGLFAQTRVLHGAVTWPGELDLAPDAMHAAIQQSGEWRPA